MFRHLQQYFFYKLSRDSNPWHDWAAARMPVAWHPLYLRGWYKRRTKKDLNLRTPKNFSEKVQWLKLHETTPLKTKLADKYRMREWAAPLVGEERLLPLLGVWDRFDAIDFDTLPGQFVLKAAHGSGWNIVVTDKSRFDRLDAKKRFDVWLRTNYAYRNGLELQYRDIPPRIVAEPYLEDLVEYKIMCANGAVMFVMVVSGLMGEDMQLNYVDPDWGHLPVRLRKNSQPPPAEKPAEWEAMLDMARILGREFTLVRVDLFNSGGNVYLNEMTFTPWSGLTLGMTPEADAEWGAMVRLPFE